MLKAVESGQISASQLQSESGFSSEYLRTLLHSLEMIGYFSDAPGSQELPHPTLAVLYSSRGNFIAVVGRLGDGALVRRVKSAMHRYGWARWRGNVNRACTLPAADPTGPSTESAGPVPTAAGAPADATAPVPALSDTSSMTVSPAARARNHW